MTSRTDGVKAWIEQSNLLKVALVFFLVIILQIPISMIEGLNRERDANRQQATEDVMQKWGKQQIIAGPKIIVPYRYQLTETLKGGATTTRGMKSYAIFLPQTLAINSKVLHEYRYRGIYKVPLYQANIAIDGTFAKPDFNKWGIAAEDILWNEARLMLNVSDVRAIQKQFKLRWDKQDIAFEPGSNHPDINAPGFHAPLKGYLDKDVYHFAIQLKLNGSEGLYFSPVGKTTDIKLESDWSNPSFQGNWLPTQRDISEGQFSAAWVIPYLGRDFPQSWKRDSSLDHKVQGTTVGVNFISPVNNYTMIERSVKYQALFLLLTFLVIWLFEVLAKLRIHPLQYLMIGASMCLFYLLLLSLSEHLGMMQAYIIASISVIVAVTSYSLAVLKTGKRAAIIGSILALLYGYLFVLLKEQDYALMFGSLGLFLALTAVMYLTRHIDWYGINSKQSD